MEVTASTIYLMGVLGAANMIFSILFICCLGGLLLNITHFLVCSDDEIKAAIRYIKLCVVLSCLTGVITIITPSKQTCYEMIIIPKVSQIEKQQIVDIIKELKKQ